MKNQVGEGTFRQSMSWLHTWAGLVFGWLLYFMFLTGTLGYFDDEISRWMEPETPIVESLPSQAELLKVAERRLNMIAADAPVWYVNFPTGRSSKFLIEWQEPANVKTGNKGEWQEEALHPLTGEPLKVRETGGGRVLYRMHYALHYLPRTFAYWLTSVAAMFMLLALITGIVIHKKIFKDFFTFRPGKKQRSWLDAHNLLSVLPLPFHLMITYSGLIFLMYTTMPGVFSASYGVDGRDQFNAEIYQEPAAVKSAAKAANNVPIQSVFAKLAEQLGNAQVKYLKVEHRGDANAQIHVVNSGYRFLGSYQKLIFSGVTGELLSDKLNNKLRGSVTVRNVLIDLHEGLFAGPWLRWLYFLSGLLGTGMIASGMILWVSKRRQEAQRKGVEKFSLVLVDRLNVGAIAGLPLAVAMYFFANRVLPLDLSNRADWEVHTLFISLGLCLLYSNFRPAAKAWVELLLASAFICLLLPLINFVMTDNHLGVSLAAGDWVVAGFDLTLLFFGLVCFLTALQLQKHAAKK